MLYIYVNPKAGNGKAQRVWKRLAPRLERSGLCYEVIVTSYAGEITEKCRALSERSAAAHVETPQAQHIVVVVGGDGSIHEAVNGLLGSIEPIQADNRCLVPPALAYIPAGSGNDYARGHGIPIDPEQALEALIAAVQQGRFKQVDVLRTDDRIAASSFGAGLDGAVAHATNFSSAKRLLGRIGLGSVAYVLTLVRVLAGYRPADAVLEIDGERHTLQGIWLSAFSNIDYFGGGMRITPSANPSDGLVDICIVSGLSRLELLRAFPRVYKGSHTSHPNIAFYRGRNVKLEASEPLCIHADGEYAGETPVTVQVCPQALTIVDQRLSWTL